MPSRNFHRGLLLLLAWLTFGPGAWGYTHAQLGTVVQDMELPMLAGGSEHLLSASNADIFLFFRPNQEYSRLALKELAVLIKDLSGKPVRWVGVVSDRYAKADVEAMVHESGLSIPILIDTGDHLYGTLGVAQVPVTVLCDQQHRLAAYQPFTKVNYTEIVRARVRYLLKEIGDAELAEVLNPSASLTDSDDAAASRRLILATKLFEAKNYDKALESIDASIQKNPSAAAYALRGDILVAQGKCPDAVEAYQQALKLEPQNARALQGIKACPEQKP